MSDERRERQRQGAVDASPLGKLRRAKNKLLWLLGIGAFGDLIKESARSRVMEWSLLTFGKYGRWIAGNPLSLLTVVVVGILAWIIWIALMEGVAKYEFAVFSPQGHKIVQPRFSAKFLAGLVAVGCICIVAVVYGAYVYYVTPFPPYVREVSNWFDTHYKGADLWIAINVANFSDQPLVLTADPEVTAYGAEVPKADDPEMRNSVKILPGRRMGWHTLLTWTPLLRDAYSSDNIRVKLNVHYDVGQT